ncbi:MAG: ABC transporter permease [Burkholderiales bacterium]|nr:ABC transporter permease [Burkholderiales bacterium]
MYPTLGIVGVLACWHFAIVVFAVPEYVLPTPLQTATHFFGSIGKLVPHALVTIYETLAGLLLAIAFSTVLAALIVWFRPVERLTMPVVVLLQTTPKIAVAPLFLIWFGMGFMPKIVISFWLAYFPILISMITGLRDVQPEMVELSRSMSASKLSTFLKVRLPNSLPHFFSGLKLAGIVALLGAVLGEYFGADKGLGYLIMWANGSYDVKLLFSIVIALVLIGRAIYFAIVLIERFAISWHVSTREGGELFHA